MNSKRRHILNYLSAALVAVPGCGVVGGEGFSTEGGSESSSGDDDGQDSVGPGDEDDDGPGESGTGNPSDSSGTESAGDDSSSDDSDSQGSGSDGSDSSGSGSDTEGSDTEGTDTGGTDTGGTDTEGTDTGISGTGSDSGGSDSGGTDSGGSEGSTGGESSSTGADEPQVIFSESFVDATFPAGWTRINVDGRTPAANVNYVNDAWVSHNLIEQLAAGQGFAATSTSWYSPAGAADDWMVTPLIDGITAQSVLTFNAMAPDQDYRDGYQVWVTTTGTTTNDFLVNGTMVLSVAAEQSSLTARQIDLSDFAGESIYIAWRNNSNDMFLLWVDDIVVTD